MPQTWDLDILSATWGDRDVTAQARTLYRTFIGQQPAANRWQLVPSSSFDFDLIPGNTKVFILVFRVLLSQVSSIDAYSYSAPQTAFALENQTCTVNFDGSTLSPWSPSISADGLVVISAFWYNVDITDLIVRWNAAVVQNQPLAFTVGTNMGNDPAFGTIKQGCVTYAYAYGNNVYDFHVKVARDRQTASIRTGPPPRLAIHAANFGGVDVKDFLTSMINSDQSLSFSMSPFNSAFPDPWPGVAKTMSILYSWGSRPLELLVTWDWTGTATLDPQAPVDPKRTSFFNPSRGRYAGKTNIIAVVWGNLVGLSTPVGAAVFDKIEAAESFVPNNTYMGFDGWSGTQKTCQVFYQYGISGSIQCIGVRDSNNVAQLPRRSVQMADPLPARGLLAPSPRTQGFVLKSALNGKYVRISDVLGGGLVATGTSAIDSSTVVFSIAPVTSGFPRPALSATWPTSTGTTTTWVKSREDTNTISFLKSENRSTASRVDYELPSSSASVGCLIGLSNGSPLAAPHVLTIADDDSKKLMVTEYAEANNMLRSIFIFEFRPATNLEDPADPPPPILLASFRVIKDIFWDLPVMFAGFPQVMSNGISRIWKWFQELSSDDKLAVMSVIAVMHNSIFVAVNPSFTSLLGYAANILDLLYTKGMMWGLFHYFTADFSWTTWGVMWLNMLKFLTSLAVPLLPELYVLEKAGEGLLWAIKTSQDVLALQKAYVGDHLSAAAQAALLKFDNTLGNTLRKNINVLKTLTTSEQLSTIHLLLLPHYHQIASGSKLLAPMSGQSRDLGHPATAPEEKDELSDQDQERLAMYTRASERSKAAHEVLQQELEKALTDDPL